MKKLLLNFSLIIAFLFTTNLIFAQYQLTNSGFENWEGVSQKKPGLFGGTISGDEPTQWNSFVTAQVKSSTFASAIEVNANHQLTFDQEQQEANLQKYGQVQY